MADREIYKTTVTCTIGFSIASIDPKTGQPAAWEKSSVSIATESGTGYPSKEELSYMLHCQMTDAVDGCEEQLNTLANKIIELSGSR